MSDRQLRSQDGHVDGDISFDCQPQYGNLDELITRRYDTAARFWSQDSSTDIMIYDPHRQSLLLCAIPVSFLQGGGREMSWSYIFQVLQAIIVDAGTLFDQNGKEYTRSSVGIPAAGDYAFRKLASSDDQPLRITRGPSYKSPLGRVAPNCDIAESTVSNSKRSTADQSKFREKLIYRDGNCVVSEFSFVSCVAAHIAPYSRRDVYKDILGPNGESYLFDVSAGLLLRDDLHSRYDRLEWSLYCSDDGAYYVHFFTPRQGQIDKQYHGKKLDPKDPVKFRLPHGDTRDLPSRKLLNWHYQQCVQARFRGFAYNMAVNAQGGAILPQLPPIGAANFSDDRS